MPELAAIRAGIAANLSTLNNPGIEVLAGEDPISVQVSAYPLPNPTMPSVMVTSIEEVDYNLAARTGLMFVVVVQAFVSEGADESAHRILDRLLIGVSAVKKLIETIDNDNRVTLGGTVTSARVVRGSGHKFYKLTNTQALGAEWAVQVTAVD